MTKLLIVLLLALAAIFLLLGITLPIIRFDRLYVFSETPSLLQLVAGLWDEGDLALALLIGAFSIGFPVVKLTALGLEILQRQDRSSFLRRMMPHLSKWSMMDVMLVAIVIFAAKSSGMAQAVTQAGLWFYAGSALIAAFLPALMSRLKP